MTKAWTLGMVLAVTAPALAVEAAVAEVEATVAPGPVHVGKPAKLQIKFRVPEGSHISPDAPLTIKLKAPESVSFEKQVLHYKDAVQPAGAAPRFEVAATATAAGEHDIEAAMTYYVCTADLCNRQTKTEHLTLSVK